MAKSYRQQYLESQTKSNQVADYIKPLPPYPYIYSPANRDMNFPDPTSTQGYDYRNLQDYVPPYTFTVPKGMDEKELERLFGVPFPLIYEVNYSEFEKTNNRLLPGMQLKLPNWVANLPNTVTSAAQNLMSKVTPTTYASEGTPNSNNSDYNAVALIKKYFPKSEWQTAYAVMMGESSGQNIPSNFNQRKTENSHGLFQINLDAHPEMATKVYDPEENVKFAAKLQKQFGWQPWGAYTDGNYRKFLGEASQVMGTPQQGGFEGEVGKFMAALTPTAYASEGETPNVPTTLPASSEVMSNYPEYTVKKGDTLWDIAQQNLGSGFRWKELMGYTGEPTKMPIGTKITIPQQYTAPTPQQQVSKYFEPNTMGGFKIPETQTTPQPTQKFVPFQGMVRVPAPTPAYITKTVNPNPISRYFEPGNVGGYQTPTTPLKSNTNVLQDVTNWWKKNIWGIK